MATAKARKRASTSGERPTAVTLADMDDWIKILYYGDWGSGKTTDLAHMAFGGQVLWVNAESGIKRRPLEHHFKVPLERIEIVPDPRKRSRVSFEMLDRLFWETLERLESDPGSVFAVAIDSATDIYKVLLEDVTRRETDRAFAKAERQGVEAEIDPFFIDRSYYGIQTEQMRQIIRNFRDLPCHLGISALTRRDKDEETGEVLYGPALNPALQTDVLGWVDLVCRTEAVDLGDDGDPVYYGHFVTEGIKVAKDRYKTMPKKMVDPTFDRVLAYLNGELTVESDPKIQVVKQRRRAVEAARKERRRQRRNRSTESKEQTTEDNQEEE